MTTPIELYNQKIASSHIQANPAQFKIISLLDALYQKIMLAKKAVFLDLFKIHKFIKGIYIYGGVGRGKTFLADLLYECLPDDLVLRIHFHHFMHKVHALLTTFQGKIDPLEYVAEDFAQYKVLIFDEFYVSDITDAMLLGILLQKLFVKDVVVVATSNIAPDLLYANGLQRNKFLPAIAAINSTIDFRMRALTSLEVFYSPITEHTEQMLKICFDKMSANIKPFSNRPIVINARQIMTKMYSTNTVWFDFENLCDGPRSAEDYIQIARIYDTVIISNVPQFDEHNENSAHRFINLIDELYERKIKLIISCASPVPQLFITGVDAAAFARTLSRLHEMQSKEYMMLNKIR
jgi:cell division protein ZapE